MAGDGPCPVQVALKMISQQRGLEYKNNPQEDMAKLLEYEASLQCKDPEDVSWPHQAGLTDSLGVLGVLGVLGIAVAALVVR